MWLSEVKDGGKLPLTAGWTRKQVKARAGHVLGGGPWDEKDAHIDNQQFQLHAFAMVREAIGWLDRTLPLAARFPKGSVFREDRQPVPPEALRETIINAVVHRDLGLASGYVAIAVFDDLIEVRSVGELPSGLRAEQLSEEHPSRPRNPDLAGTFHRMGAIEVWGRGTNRVIEACRAWGIEPPKSGRRSARAETQTADGAPPEPRHPPASRGSSERAPLRAPIRARTLVVAGRPGRFPRAAP